jgi:mRNA interferase RelE/StbE
MRSEPSITSLGVPTEVANSDGIYTTRFTATGKRDLDKLPPRVLAAVIEFAFGDLAREPRRVGKPLRRELVGPSQCPTRPLPNSLPHR